MGYCSLDDINIKELKRAYDNWRGMQLSAGLNPIINFNEWLKYERERDLKITPSVNNRVSHYKKMR